MSNNVLNVVAASMSSVAAIAAWRVAWLSLKDSRAAAKSSKQQMSHALNQSFQTRLDPMYPGLRELLGGPDDGVPIHVRSVLVPFFVLCSDTFAAKRDNLIDTRDWNAFNLELSYWAQQPLAAETWASFRRQEWTDGFVAHMDCVIAGAPAYPKLGLPCEDEAEA